MTAIGFSFKPSVGFLSFDDMKLIWLPKIGKEHAIFQQLAKADGFDFYFIRDILIIPDPIPVAKENWNRKIDIDSVEIECSGNWLSFYSFEKTEKGIFLADSLTLPQFEFLKNRIRWA